MKRSLLLVSAILALSLSLSACGKKNEENNPPQSNPTSETLLLDSIYRPDADYSHKNIASSNILEYTGAYAIFHNEYFTVFSKTEDNTSSLHFYSLTDDREIAKYTKGATETDSGTVYTGYHYATTSMISAVFSYTTDKLTTVTGYSYQIPASDATIKEMKLEFFDATGNVFYTMPQDKLESKTQTPQSIFSYINDLPSKAYFYGNTDLFALDNTVFRYDAKSGSVEKIKSFDATTIPVFSLMSSDYYYAIDNSNGIIQSFDRSLERVSTAVVSTEAFEQKYVLGALPEGNVIIQYKRLLPSDATEYDIIETEQVNGSAVSKKYKLNTLIVFASSGDIQKLDASFVINKIYNLTVKDLLEGSDIYSSTLNGISVIAEIDYINEYKEVLDGYEYFDIVALSGNGEIIRSLKLAGHWITVPQIISNGYFSVETANREIEIIDRSGAVIFTYSKDYANSDNPYHIATETAIYNVLTGEKIYDFKDRYATVKKTASGIFTIEEKNDDGSVSLIAVLLNGELKTLGTIGTNGNIGAYFFDEYGMFCILNNASGKYEYYNTYGTPLGSFEEKLILLNRYNNGIIFEQISKKQYFEFVFGSDKDAE